MKLAYLNGSTVNSDSNLQLLIIDMVFARPLKCEKMSKHHVTDSPFTTIHPIRYDVLFV